ncbi:MAG: DUF86 domain-containing protein [Candidatus Pacearchaeota archaeon]
MNEHLKEHLMELKKRLALWKEYERISLKEFEKNLEKQDAIMHNMLIAIQASIDSGNDIIKMMGISFPITYKDTFLILNQNKIISKELANELSYLAKFRNALVHLYAKIDIMKL